MLKAISMIMAVGAVVACLADEQAAPSSAQAAIAPVEQPIAPPSPLPAPPALKFNGWGWLTLGRVGQSPWIQDGYDVNFTDEWLIDYDAGIKFTASMPHDWKARFHLGMTTAYPIIDQRKKDDEMLRRKLALYMIDAAMEKTITLGDAKLFIECGFFPVKYNPQAMNLGEYLYRSGTYPQYLISGFELSDKEKLTGVHVSYKNTIKNPMGSDGWFKGDLYLTVGMRDYPIHDISPSLLLAAGDKFMEVGAGVEFSHLITIDNRKTTPWNDTNFYNKDNLNSQDNAFAVYVDPVTKELTVYTFKGVKSEVRLTLNPQAFFSSKFLGKEDLKLYGELAVLGWKNYPGWYQNRTERMPVMFGMNFPTYQPLAYTAIPALLGGLLTDGGTDYKTQRALAYGIGGLALGTGLALIDHLFNVDTKADVLALEGEYYAYKYINSSENVWRSRSPVPFVATGIAFYRDRNTVGGWYDRTTDDYKWSVYTSKKLLSCLRVSAMVASDHSQRTQYMYGPPATSSYLEIVPYTTNWYWMARVMYYF
jgi:hypothetical protein